MASSSLEPNQLILDPQPFDPNSISNATKVWNKKLMSLMAGAPKWYQVGAPEYRRMRAAGKTPLPGAKELPNAIKTSIPSRDSGRSIPCRMFKPTDGSPIKGVFYHIHGGGWVLQTEASQDPLLQTIAGRSGTLVISVGYRLAPEHPFPAGPNDCYDVAEWLVENAQREYGASLSFVGGESAGAHLSMLVALHLMQHKDEKFAKFKFKGLVLHYGCYDLTWTPSVFNFKKPEVLVLDADLMVHYADVFLPGMSAERKKLPDVSPLYADLNKLRGQLPPALFTCGTEDPLLDDTVFMSARWMMAGGEAVVKFIPGGAHGYTYYLGVPESGSRDGMDFTVDFMAIKLS